MHLRILDIDSSLSAQAGLATAARLDWRDLAQGLRLWGTSSALAEARGRLPAFQPGELSFIGSGDFHHLAALLIERAPMPLTLVHFDNHPDWVRLPPAWHCGSWINRVLERPQIAKVVTLGPCSDDLDWPQLKGGNWPALMSGRLELYPWRHAPSRLLLRPAYRWTELSGLDDPAAFLDQLFAGLPTQDVWVSIDKDVLAPQQAATNWDQGGMSLEFLESALRLLAGRRRIVGADVCGDYSPARFVSPWKRLSARMDHPTAPQDDPALNDAANRRLIALFDQLLTAKAA